MTLRAKHQRLVFVTNEAGVLVIAAHGLPAQVWTNTSRRLENNAELARGPGGEPDREVQITPEITFGDGEAVKGKPVVTALRDFGSLAATIIKTFDI